MSSHVALLRGINVGGHRRVPMAELRMLADDAGFRDARTYVASGNLVLASDVPAAAIEAVLEQAIAQRFGFAVDVVARSAVEWRAYLADQPFGSEGEAEPNLVMLCVGKQLATHEDAAALRSRAGPRERVELRGDALWLYFGDGAGRSKMGLGPGGGIWTTRNLRTVRTIAGMLD
ncbi:DUF1697 domain-containing protein [Sphingomonas desiccabilis]|uniref:DUF1697 domain-containing protein n=1 Tax=Sphingomonas desiccabilis TaxID=429134 RepID=A0A4Q2IT26_9SPHN|nr:DUF1697 domain-containing protein [Sphingomonas desiccabilis]MBB3911601.1 uncharacterized protein (DUF1697 family) [Sphingomonas desiccabilis]RXZ31657.1 DUF1697 domain-containing protein [Sphingomonas desiccabilis]